MTQSNLNQAGVLHIPLTKGHFAIIDAEDYNFVMQWKWQSAQARPDANIYAKRTHRAIGGRKTIAMHRLIMNCPDDMQVDHIDGNGLNNSKSNLRICTRLQNNLNRKINKSNATGFKGIYKHGISYCGEIGYQGKQYQLGAYNNPELAAKVYDIHALKFNGEFANTNFPLTIDEQSELWEFFTTYPIFRKKGAKYHAKSK